MESKSKKSSTEEFKMLSREEYEALSEDEKKKYSEEVGECLLKASDQITNQLIDLYNILKELSESDLNEKD